MSFNALPNQYSDLTLDAVGFWPELSVAEFQRLYRLPGEYAAELLLDHLALARTWAAGQLGSWRVEQAEAGYQHLTDVPLNDIPGEAVRVWKRAVFSHAKALLLPQFATMDRREAAKNEAKEGQESADTFFAQANNAIADLLGQTRIMVGLV